MKKLIIGWIIISVLGIGFLNFQVKQLGNHEPYTAENIEWSRSDQTARLEKQKFYVNLIFFFLGAEILGFGILVFLSISEKRRSIK